MTPQIAWEKWVPKNKSIVQDGWEGPEYEELDTNEDNFSLPVGIAFSPMEQPEPILLDCDDFNFWMGHCNFFITKEMCNAMLHIPGAEAIDIPTRHRMRVAIGKMFSPKAVMQHITKVLTEIASDGSKLPY
jgi:hypothetical protein